MSLRSTHLSRLSKYLLKGLWSLEIPDLRENPFPGLPADLGLLKQLRILRFALVSGFDASTLRARLSSARVYEVSCAPEATAGLIDDLRAAAPAWVSLRLDPASCRR